MPPSADASSRQPRRIHFASLERLAAVSSRSRERNALLSVSGRVSAVRPGQCLIEGLSPSLKLGDCVAFETHSRREIGIVAGIELGSAIVVPLEVDTAVGVGDRATVAAALRIFPHPTWKGRVIGAIGEAIDGGPRLQLGGDARPLDTDPPAPMSRTVSSTAIRTGVRAIDLFTPMCAGQRIGIFAGSGVGKSSLLQMLVRGGSFDTAVIALVGERGREVKEFVELLRGAGLARSVIVAATSDESPMRRVLAPRTAVAVAEHFRDRGENVLLIVDSVTRYAHALREVAMAANELPVARGFGPSVFAALPRLLERTGTGPEGTGTMTAVFSVLVDGDDHNDPVADTVRGILDGHIVLDRRIAHSGRYPAIDVTASLSRMADRVVTPAQRDLIAQLRSLVQRYEETQEIRAMAGHRPGQDALLDQAIDLVPRLYDALRQTPDDPASTDPYTELARYLKPAAESQKR